ncbi:MAG: hypothetical protein JSV03_09030 [Planctomycetota bacterium]|nr:MAG: hypothetical protein JSV03_09030 [Planctomycetota bacterium]
MPYAIDLSPRQSLRTLEQAVRHGAEVILHPCILPDGITLTCRTEAMESSKVANSIKKCLVLIPVINKETIGAKKTNADGAGSSGKNMQYEDFLALVGTYCDAQIILGENRYLFSSDVIGIQAPTSPDGKTRIALSHPDTIQLAQRRRYRRFQPARSTQVQLWWTNNDNSNGNGIGWLCNVSENGFACRADLQVTEQLGIGEQIRAEFSLGPGEQEQFALDAILCNKMPAGTQGKMILGLQFAHDPEYADQNQSIKALRQQLLARFASMANATEGADT